VSNFDLSIQRNDFKQIQPKGGMHLAFVLKAAHEVTTAPIRALDYADKYAKREFI